MSARFPARSAAVLALAAVLICRSSPSQAEQAAAAKVGEAISPEQAIRQALAKPVELKFVETRLVNVAKSLEKTLGVPVRLDSKALDDVGISDDRPVTFQVSGISARSALELLLREPDLTWVIAHKMLLITTPGEAQVTLETRTYDVTDLTAGSSGSQRSESLLVDVMTSCIDPDDWDDRGGAGSIEASLDAAGRKVLDISQNQHAHQGIEILLWDLRKARTERLSKGKEDEKRHRTDNSASRRGPRPQSPEERIRDALNKPIRLESSKTPLAEVVQSLREKAGVQIIIDRKALRNMVRGTGTPVTVHADDIKLRSVLDSMLKELDLTWTIAYEVLLITTPEEAASMLRTKVYDVSDLAADRNGQGEREPNQESLLSRIRARLYPESWDVVGGPGSIAPFDTAGIQVLVVWQTWKIHEEIESLLDKLRK